MIGKSQSATATWTVAGDGAAHPSPSGEIEMRVLILGAGGVGGYIGSRLLPAGADVVFLARGQRLADLSANGLTVQSPLGNFSAPVRVVGDASSAEFSPDLIILACKAPALADALDAIASSVGPETRILPLLNGVAHLETLRRRFPQTPMLAGIVHGALTLHDSGVIQHLTPFFASIVGSMDGASDPVAEEFVRSLSDAGVDARLSHDIRQDLWNKFVFLATLAGITCLMRASIGTILTSDDGQDLILQLLDECLAVAEKEGFAPDEASMDTYRRSLTEPGSTFTSSMLRDILSGRRTEGDHILGDMLRRGRRHGLVTPLLSIANAHLQCFEATRALA